MSFRGAVAWLDGLMTTGLMTTGMMIRGSRWQDKIGGVGGTLTRPEPAELRGGIRRKAHYCSSADPDLHGQESRAGFLHDSPVFWVGLWL
ncbi:MAG: hypothetical protein GY904_01035 [Planctomycetaceae bacterium]|nr:hypothetical protein [Planctomycetaceae bacterium]